jgi:hypothetical protein
MSSTSVQDPFQAEVDRLRQLRDKIALKEVAEAMDDTERDVNALPGKLAAIRTGGYLFKNYLEQAVERLTGQWRDQRLRAQVTLRNQQSALQADAAAIQTMHNRHTLVGMALDNLENKATAALRSLQAIYEATRDEAKKVQAQLDDVAWTLQQIGQATFSLASGEAAVEAVPANWKKPGDKDGVEGVLFLTDQRLLFEQREEIATKKVLFVTTAKQKVQGLQWGMQVAQVVSAVGSKKGFLGKDDYLTLTCTPDAAFQATDLHLKGESGETWRGHIERVKSGGLAKERVGQAQAGAFTNVPWGAAQPLFVRDSGSATGMSAIRAHGTLSVVVSDPRLVPPQAAGDDAAVRNAFQSKLVSKLWDLLGTLITQEGRSTRDLSGFIGEIALAVRNQAQSDFNAMGYTLTDVVIQGIEVKDAS